MKITTSGGRGLDAFRARLERVASGAHQASARELVRAEVTALVDAQRVPVRTGALLASRQIVVTDDGASVTYTSEHASFVNDGTSRMGAEPFMPALDELGARVREARARALRAALGGGAP